MVGLIHRILFLALAAVFVLSCSPVAHKRLDKTFHSTEERFQDYTGFILFDPQNSKTVYEYNAARYFAPASNTKILTLFASLKILGDSVPALRYVIRGDSLIFWGTGDPSFLYKNVHADDRVYSFLNSAGKRLFLSTANFDDTHFGPGWAWDDYAYSYSSERSPLPVYGNSFSVKGSGKTIRIEPHYMNKYVTFSGQSDHASVVRSPDNNNFTVAPSYNEKYEFTIPFKVDPVLTSQLIADTLKKDIGLVEMPLPQDAAFLFSVPVDSLYKVLMEDSDNFIAEQLLLLCSGIIGDTLNTEVTIRHVMNNFLTDVPDRLNWVDGSGLSRYNLLTPRSVVHVWNKIYSIVPRERLFAMLATGGKSGTIRNWYNGIEGKPYIFGKTGTIRNNHCLSGYLVARSGKTFIFSFMNSNFTVSVNDVRKNMQTILNLIYENY